MYEKFLNNTESNDSNNSGTTTTTTTVHNYTEKPYVIVNTQPRIYKQEQWSSSLCNCFEDIHECCCAYFCTTCYLCSLYSRANEGCCTCLVSPLSHLRTKVRVERGIYGSLCGDVCASLFCPFCVMVQLGIQMRRTDPLI